MKSISTVTGVLALSVALCMPAAAQNATTPLERSAPAASDTSRAKASKDTSSYVEKSAQGDLFELHSSELALKQAESADVKAFAQRMINDHTASSQALKAGIQSANLDVKVPDKLDKAHEAKVNNLRKATGRDFDRLYMRDQLGAHKQALQIHKNYAEKGDNPVLKKTAANAAVIIEHHLAEAQEIAKGVPQTSSTR
jgi:putative membrane protein